MKGQYLAVESVLTIAMGLSLAIGTIAIFSDYQEQVSENTGVKQVQVVKYRMHNGIYRLKEAGSGTAEVELPEDIAGMDYTVALGEDITVITADREYSAPLTNFEEFKMQGSSNGGEVILYKRENQYTLRSS